MSRPDAVVFDMDGTLTDTEVVWERVRRRLTEDLGRPYPPGAAADMMGMSTPEWARFASEVLGHPGTPDQVARRIIDAVADAFRVDGVRVLPGAADAVRRMAARGPVAVASSSPPELIDAGLEAAGVAGLVSVRVSSESVGVGKPAPDVYLRACGLLGVRPQDALAVEDSRAGILSAAEAGLRVVAVPLPPHEPPPEVLTRAAAVLSTLEELTIPLVTKLFVD